MINGVTEYTDGMHVRNNGWDAHILRQVALRDEYHMKGLLKPDDVVLDIGAHIGSFSYLAMKEGVQPWNIWAFEAFPDNFELLTRNLGGRSVRCMNVAVWSTTGAVRNYDGPKDNTGGGNVFWNHSTQISVPTISLDDILYSARAARERDEKPYTGVRVMKIDCETSEFPIILSSSRIREIQTIVGEYHETHDVPSEAQPANWPYPVEAYTFRVLEEFLTFSGFKVQMLDRIAPPGANAIGHFRAERVD